MRIGHAESAHFFRIYGFCGGVLWSVFCVRYRCERQRAFAGTITKKNARVRSRYPNNMISNIHHIFHHRDSGLVGLKATAILDYYPINIDRSTVDICMMSVHKYPSVPSSVPSSSHQHHQRYVYGVHARGMLDAYMFVCTSPGVCHCERARE